MFANAPGMLNICPLSVSYLHAAMPVAAKKANAAENTHALCCIDFVCQDASYLLTQPDLFTPLRGL